MHLLLVNVFFPPQHLGGATKVADAVARCLVASHGARVSVISATARLEVPPYAVLKAERAGVVNYQINLPAHRRAEELYDNGAVEEVALSLVRDLAPDLVNVHCVQELGGNLVGAFRDAGLPVILSTHDFWWLCERQFMIRSDGKPCRQDPVRIEACAGCVADLDDARNRFHELQRQAGRADLVTFPSRFARDLSQRSGMGRGNGVVWENGVSMPQESFFEQQRERRAKDPRLAFGFVGDPSAVKGWHVIRDGFARLPRGDFVVNLIEGGSPGAPWYDRSDFRTLPGEWVFHPPYRADTLDGFFARIDVLLFMSQCLETFGLSVREALARGVRVVQTDGGGSAEHGARHMAEFLKIGDGPAMLAEALERELGRPRREAGAVRVRTFEEQAAELLQLAQRLVAERNSGEGDAGGPVAPPGGLRAVGG